MTEKRLEAIRVVLGIAMENSCSCDVSGTGYLGHKKDCWVHNFRDALRTVQSILDDAYRKTKGGE